MQNFIELLKDHALILASTKSLQDIAERATPAPGLAFDALRRLARLLEAHLRAEDDLIRLDGENHDREFAALGDAHGTLYEDFVAAWGTYLCKWSEEMIGQDWPTFACDTGHILGRLNAQVEDENRSLYPAALRYGLLRLLPESMRGDTIAERPAA